MNLKELQKKVAEVLGVSNSQSELAFEVFSERIYESLYEGITLKVPRVGFFQLKTGEVKNGTRSVMFTPLSVDFSRDTNNLFLTFEVHHKTKDTREIDSNVFSIGVGKPLLPLTIDDLPNSETSFAVLKKSIEERAKELIAESDQIPNFNIFEDYYKFSNSPLPADETNSTLHDLTSDMDFSHVPEEPLEATLDKKIEMLSSLIEYVPASDEPALHESEVTPKDEFSFSDNRNENAEDIVHVLNDAEETQDTIDSEGKTSESLLAELLSDEPEEETIQKEVEVPESKEKSVEDILSTIDVATLLSNTKTVEEEIPKETSAIENLEQFQPLEEHLEQEEWTAPEEEMQTSGDETPQLQEEMKKNEPATEHAEDNEIKKIEEEDLSKQEEQFVEEHYAKEQKEEFSGKEKIGEEQKLPDVEDELLEDSEEDLEPFAELLDSDKHSEEKIEWNWGDELREEFGLGHLESEEANYEMVEDKKAVEKEEAEPEIEKDSIRDLFAQLEKTLEHDRAFLDEQPHEERKPAIEAEIPTKKQEFKDEEKVYLEYDGPPSKYEFVPVKTSEEERRSKMAISLAEEPGDYFDRRLSYSGERNERQLRHKQKSGNGGSKIYLLYIATVAVVSVAVYLVFRSNAEPTGQNLKTPQQNVSQSKIDSIKTAVEKAPDSAKYLLDESSDFPISATPPVPSRNSQNSQNVPAQTGAQVSKKISSADKQPDENQNDLYQTPKSDTRITNSIYYDGKNYNFQASSWRNKVTAEQEVQRLRGLNFKAYLVEAYLPQKGGTWYRVRIGPFKSENETRQFMSENDFK